MVPGFELDGFSSSTAGSGKVVLPGPSVKPRMQNSLVMDTDLDILECLLVIKVETNAIHTHKNKPCSVDFHCSVKLNFLIGLLHSDFEPKGMH